MADLKEFKTKVVERFCETITDNVFLMIQNDRALMQEYIELIEKGSSRANMNSQIAKEVKKHFNLKNQNERNEEPKSSLIAGHEKFDI